MTALCLNHRYKHKIKRPRRLRQRRLVLTDTIDPIGKRNRVDPTGTTNIRNAWEAELERRVGSLRSVVAESIVNSDLLALSGSASSSVGAAIFARTFTTAPDDKAAAFVSWFYDEQLRRVLNVRVGFDRGWSARESWMRPFVDRAYAKGVRDALAERKIDFPQGGLSREPFVTKLALARAKAFGDTEGILDAMSTVVSRVVLQALAESWTPQRAARELNRQAVDRVGLVRARTMVRSETVRIYNEAALDAMEDAGIEKVRVFAEAAAPSLRTDGIARDAIAAVAVLSRRKVEFMTAGDEKVCPDCEKREGKIYTLRYARGLIPIHPNCRCSFLPVEEDD